MHGCHTLCSDVLHCLGGVDVLGACGCSVSRCWSGPRFVLVYTLSPDSDAELRGKDGIRVERRFVVYGELGERIFPCCCRCWCHGSPGVEVQLVAVTSGPPRPPPRQCQTPRWDRLSACQLHGQRRLIVWSDLFWWNLWRALLLSLASLTAFLLPPLLPNWKFPLVPLTKQSPDGGKRESVRGWERETKNNLSWSHCCQIPGLAAVCIRFEYHLCHVLYHRHTGGRKK